MRRFYGKRCLVFGGAGFLGSHLVEALVREGASKVLVIDDFSTGRKKNLVAGVSAIRHDISTWDGITVLAEDAFDYVINLACPASPPIYDLLWDQTLGVCSTGVGAAIRVAHQHGAVFFHASTSEIYGEPHIVPTPESDMGRVDPTSPRSVYDEGKRFAETMVYAYHRKLGVDVRVVRISNTFGPRMRLDDGRVVTEFIKAALTGKSFPVFGDGTQTRSLCYVDDMIEGFLRLLLSEETRPMNMGGQCEMTIREIADLVAKLCGVVAPIDYMPLPQSDPTRRLLDITRAREVLDWEPKVSVEDGLLRTIEWARKELA